MERAVLALVRKVYGGREQPTPDWIQRPGRRGSAGGWIASCSAAASRPGSSSSTPQQRHNPGVGPAQEQRRSEVPLTEGIARYLSSLWGPSYRNQS
jgi:hypothetical protein